MRFDSNLRRVREPDAERTDWGGFASFSGVLMLSSLPADTLSALLLPPLQLMPIGPNGQHPLVLAFGEMSNGGAHIAGVDIAAGARYREVGVMIPFVHHPDCAGPVMFPYRMYADDVRPVFLGNSCYGLRKDFARIDWAGEHFEVLRGTQCHFGAAGAIQGAWSKLGPDSSAGFRSLYEMFQLPILGRRNGGRFVRLFFGWSFDSARVADFSGNVRLLFEESGQVLRLNSAETKAYAVRTLGWRTSAPSLLSND